jgi:hypothetical protein
MKTGNVNHVAAFEKLVGICNDLGARYNPSKAALTTPALATLLEQAQQSLEAVNAARISYVLAINSRQDLFAGVSPLAARIVRALASSESSIGNIKAARMLKRRLTPQPTVKGFVKVESSEGSTTLTPGIISRLDYNSRAETFRNLVMLVKDMPSYAPNESDLQVSALLAMADRLRNASLVVTATSNALAAARIQRNVVLKGKEGMFEIGNAVKEYIRSVFGVRSEPAREVGKLNLAA